MAWVGALLCILAAKYAVAYNDNSSLPSNRQLLDFKLKHPKPIGLWTLNSGAPVEIRDLISTNSDLFKDELFFDAQSHLDGEIIPHRIVQAKGVATWGYFEVTNDVSKYTKANVFNGVGKKTPILARHAVGVPGNGGSDLRRDIKDLAVKFYTEEGILDFLSLTTPLFDTKDPLEFPQSVHSFERRNPKTFLMDNNMFWDILSLRPGFLSLILYLMSDYGLPDGWRHSDYFPIHTYELVNKDGDRWYARFSWRTEQGLKFLTSQDVQQINDEDYFIRDLYNAIESKHYPSWRLEMDVLSLHDIQTVNFNPFDVTRLWKNGTYQTVPIGRLTLDKYSDNHFRDSEQAAFNMANLVPGIPGPIDQLFRGRRFAYRDTQNHRLGRNHFKIGVNSPNYMKNYNRDGKAPVGDNGKDSPIYYPNSFNGPLPYVDAEKPRENVQILETNSVDLQEYADFYNKILPDDSARQRLADNIVESLWPVLKKIRKRVLKLFNLIDKDLAHRVHVGLKALKDTSPYKTNI
ncbi:catalase domain-containing protein [Phthorimaea operculella]|nr:catalase domain-containing protein [Phthorimaea operculella]